MVIVDDYSHTKVVVILQINLYF